MSRETPEVLTGFGAGDQRGVVCLASSRNLHISTACIIPMLWDPGMVSGGGLGRRGMIEATRGQLQPRPTPLPGSRVVIHWGQKDPRGPASPD